MPHAAILMATYNGATYLPQQLKSFDDQSHSDWRLYVSDDGSTDHTLDVLNHYKDQHSDGKVSVFSGPRQGFAANFLSLMFHIGDDAAYFALSDQDDIWKNDKLSHAIAWLSQQPADKPALYCGTSELIDGNDRNISNDCKHKSVTPGFQNALVENIAGGNTMVFNRAAHALMLISIDMTIPWHDWWLYLTVSACGGAIYFDHTPYLLYRQHGQNVHGANMALSGIIKRIKRIWRGEYKRWNSVNLTALMKLEDQWTPSTAQTIHYFKKARQSRNVLMRFYYLHKSGVYRQSVIEHCGLFFATLFNRI